MLITEDNIYENWDSEFWISCLVVSKTWCRPGHICGARPLATPRLPGDPADSWPEKSTVIKPRFLWIQLLFKYNKPYLEKWTCFICQRSYGSSRQISLTTLFPQWLFALPTIVRLCYWANPYSLVQDPLASSVSEFSFQVVIRTMSMLMDPGAYQSSWVWIYVSHICENRLDIGFSSASTLVFMERKIQYVGH